MLRFLPYSSDQAYLLPPSVKDELGEDHLSIFVHRVVERLDRSAFEEAYSEKRGALYAPELMLKVWLYAYALGITSARRLEQRIREDIGLRYLAGGQQPRMSQTRGREAEWLASRAWPDRWLPSPGRRLASPQPAPRLLSRCAPQCGSSHTACDLTGRGALRLAASRSGNLSQTAQSAGNQSRPGKSHPHRRSVRALERAQKRSRPNTRVISVPRIPTTWARSRASAASTSRPFWTLIRSWPS